ncbi:MAG: Hpt domain-containing protein [Deltaproteobacteria bacterium]|nr:Hpt domain-containing protein [Deltaproteobacteria bacterium]
MAEKILVELDSDLRELIPEFLERRQHDLPVFRQALEAGDYETLRTMGHQMKGFGGGYGFTELTAIGAEIEQGAKARDSQAIAAHLSRLEEYMQHLEVRYK